MAPSASTVDRRQRRHRNADCRRGQLETDIELAQCDSVTDRSSQPQARNLARACPSGLARGRSRFIAAARAHVPAHGPARTTRACPSGLARGLDDDRQGSGSGPSVATVERRQRRAKGRLKKQKKSQNTTTLRSRSNSESEICFSDKRHVRTRTSRTIGSDDTRVDDIPKAGNVANDDLLRIDSVSAASEGTKHWMPSLRATTFQDFSHKRSRQNTEIIPAPHTPLHPIPQSQLDRCHLDDDTDSDVDTAGVENTVACKGAPGCNKALLADGVSLEWKYVLTDDERLCYVGFTRLPYSEQFLSYFLRRIILETEWVQPVSAGTGRPLPRKTTWMVANNCSCSYKYGRVEVAPVHYPPWMVDLMYVIMPLLGLTVPQWPDCCNANLYENGKMAVGWHADDESLFVDADGESTIVSLSLGHVRSFQLQLNAECGGIFKRVGFHEFEMHSGVIMTMERRTQQHYMHRVPRERAAGARVNLTWRWIKRHSDACHISI